MKIGKYILIYSTIIFTFSCNIRIDKLENNLFKYIDKNCKKEQNCFVSFKNITWFDWDKMVFTESEEGRLILFYKKDKIVYKYCKYFNFDNQEGIEFGTLKYDFDYSIEKAVFKIQVNEDNVIVLSIR